MFYQFHRFNFHSNHCLFFFSVHSSQSRRWNCKGSAENCKCFLGCCYNNHYLYPSNQADAVTNFHSKFLTWFALIFVPFSWLCHDILSFNFRVSTCATTPKTWKPNYLKWRMPRYKIVSLRVEVLSPQVIDANERQIAIRLITFVCLKRN